MSLSALEEKLKPEIFTNFEEIEKLYEKLAKIQQKRLDNLTAGADVNTRSEKNYEKLRDELVAKVEQVRLHNNRIEELVAQLKVLNQRLNGLEGQILRLAESCQGGRDGIPAALPRPRDGPELADRCRRAARQRLEAVRAEIPAAGHRTAHPDRQGRQRRPGCRSRSSAGSIPPSPAASAIPPAPRRK